MSRRPALLSIFLVFVSTNAEEVQLGMVAGFPEGIDFKYSWEGRYFGVSFTPGVVVLAVSQSRKEDRNSYSWNPSVSLLKTIPLTESFALVPEVGVATWYGTGTGYVQAHCRDCRVEYLRTDRSMLKLALGFRAPMGPWRLQAAPGVLFYREYTKTTGGNIGVFRRREPEALYLAPAFSLSLAYPFGNQSAQP